MPFLTSIIAGGLSALGAGAIGGGAIFIGGGPLAGIVTTGTLAIASQISSALLTVGLSFGANAALGLLNKRGALPSSSTTIKQALPGRFIDVGRVKSAGAIAYFLAPGPTLYSVRILSCTRIQEIETLFLDDYPTPAGILNTGAGTNVLFGPWSGRVAAQARLGTNAQTALEIVTPSLAWTANHRLRGMAILGVTYDQGSEENHGKFYPNGAPNPSAVIKAAMLPDPRNPAHDLSNPDTWAYSDNGARALARYCLDIDGWGLTSDDLNLPLLRQACDDADDVVATPGGTEPRYRAWGRYSTLEDRASTLRDMLAACGGVLLEQPDGTLGLFVGKHREPNPELTITDQHIIDVQLERFPDALDRVDGIKSRIVWEGAKWEEQECPVIYSDGPTYGAAPDIEDLPLKWCPSPYQGQRLAWATLKQRRPEWQGTIKTWLHGLRCYGEPVVRIVHAEKNIDGIFEILQAPTIDLSDMTVTLSVRSYDPTTWTMGAEQMTAMGSVGGVDNTVIVPAPADLEYSVDGDGDVTVTWTIVAQEAIYHRQAQWRPYDPMNGPDVGWGSLTPGLSSVTFDPTTSTVIDFRVRRISPRGYESDWGILPEIEV